MAQHVLETGGDVCPFPLIEAKKAIDQISPGDELVINFDCTQAVESLPQWAADEGNPVTSFERDGDAAWIITVQRA